MSSTYAEFNKLTSNIALLNPVGIGTTSAKASIHIEGDKFNSANIGFGTTLPQYRIHVAGFTEKVPVAGIGVAPIVQGSNATVCLDSWRIAQDVSNIKDKPFHITNISAAGLCLDTQGDVGIGTAAARSNVDVYGDLALGNTGAGAVQLFMTNATTITNSYVENSNGSVTLANSFGSRSRIDVPWAQYISGCIGWYTADSWTGTQWNDLSGNKNHAVNIIGSVYSSNIGGTTPIKFLYGSPTDGIIFPTTILPPTYTLFHVARAPGGSNGRIFDGVDVNWSSGFDIYGNGSFGTGIAYHGDTSGYITNTANLHTTDWIVSTDLRNTYRSQGTDRTNAVYTSGVSANLSINAGFSRGSLTVGTPQLTDTSGKFTISTYVIGTISTSSTIRPFGTEGSFYMPGNTTNYISITNAALQFQWWVQRFTVEAWVYVVSVANASAYPSLIGLISGGANYWSFGVVNISNTARVSFYYFNGATQWVNGSTVLQLNTWYHIAATYDGSLIRVFVNGAVDNSAPLNGTPQVAAISLQIGFYSIATQVTNAYVSNLRLVSGSAVYTAAFTPVGPLANITGTQLLIRALPNYITGGNWNVAEMIVFQRELSLSEINMVEGYLLNKYGSLTKGFASNYSFQNTLAASATGTYLATVKCDGNIGIGTTTPLARIDNTTGWTKWKPPYIRGQFTPGSSTGALPLSVFESDTITVSNTTTLRAPLDGLYLITFSAIPNSSTGNVEINIRRNGFDFIAKTNNETGGSGYHHRSASAVVPLYADEYIEFVAGTALYAGVTSGEEGWRHYSMSYVGGRPLAPGMYTTQGLVFSLEFGSGTLPTTDPYGSVIGVSGSMLATMYHDNIRGYVLSLSTTYLFTTTIECPQNYTKSIWINPSAASGNLISSYTTGNGVHYFYYNGTAVSAGHSSATAVTAYVADPSTSVTGLWQHYVVTYDNASTTMRLYKNGLQIASTTNAALNWTGGGTKIAIGAYQAVTFYNGYLDNVKIYNRALSAAEVFSLYTYERLVK
jgi:hypothetical protein